MKTKVKRMSKKSLALFLGIVMLITSIGIGSLITVDASSTAYVYYTTSSSGAWSSASKKSMSLSSNSGSVSINLSANTTYRFVITNGNSNANWWGNNTFDLSSQTSKTNNLGSYYNFYEGSNQISNSPNTLTTSTAGAYTFAFNENSGECTVSGGSGSSGGGGETPSGDASGTAVNDDNLIAVLKRTKVMIYHGDKWGSGTKYVKNGTSATDNASSGEPETLTIDNSDCYVANAYLNTGSKYSISNQETSWEGMSINSGSDLTISQAGNLYYMYNDGSNKLVTKTSSAAVSWTISTASVKSDATTCNIAATTSGTTGAGRSTTIKYYYTTNGTDFYTFNPSNLPTLTAGTTYTIYAAAYDTKIYVAAATTGTLTVYPALTTPSIKIDGVTGTRTVTASTSTTSTVSVTNVNSYSEGTVFRLYKGDSLVDSNKTGTFKISRNTGTAGTYKVIAIPGTSDTTHSDSADSNTVTFTVNKVAKPSAPTISSDPTVINEGGNVTLTNENFASYDKNIYDLVLYKSTNGSTYTAVSPAKKFTADSMVVIPSNSAGTVYYKIKAVAKNQTVYTDSDLSSTAASIRVVHPWWYSYGNEPFGYTASGSAWDKTKSYHINQYYGSDASGDTFFRVYTVDSSHSGTGFRLTSGSSSGYYAYPSGKPTSAPSTPTQVAYMNTTGSDNYWSVPGNGTYFLFVKQNITNAETTKPSMWVRTDLSLVDVTRKYQNTYNLATDDYSAVANCTDDSVFTVNADQMVVDNSSSYTFTANIADDSYEFVGWFSDAACAEANRLTKSESYTYTAPASAETKTLYPLVRKKAPYKYNIDVDKTEGVSVSATWNSRSASNGRTLKNVPEGATVTISGTSETGLQFSNITVKTASNTSVTLTGAKTGKTISSLTFTMPDEDVTIYAETGEYWGRDCTDVFLFKQNTDGSTVYSPGDYSKWSRATTSETYEVKYNEDESNKHYYIKIPISYFTTNPTYKRYFGLSNQSGWCNKGQMFWTGQTTEAAIAPGSEFYLGAEQRNYDNSYEDGTNYNYRYSAVWFKNSSYIDLVDYVLLDVHNGGTTGTYTYSVILKESSATKVSFIARDGVTTGDAGATGTNVKYKTFGAIGSTSVTTTDGTTQGTPQTTYTTFSGGATNNYYSGVLTKGTTYNIKTTVTDNRYYVKAFNVNGVSVAVLDKPASTPSNSQTYTCTYKVPSDAPPVLEIIPVYYHYNDSNCVTFYLEGYDEVIQDDLGWGNTPYIYPFYATQTGASSGGAENGHNSFGTYPGQPMVFENGVYETQIPVTNVDLCTKSGSTTETGTNIKGITINNGWDDKIHREIMGWSNDDVNHKQTYDYDDFHKIYVEKNPTNIYFQMKLKEDRDNSATYRHTSKTTLTTDEIEDIRNNGNGWELLQDKFNRTTDIIGNPLASADLTKDPLYVISTGYVQNVAGDYGTEWRVYRKNGNSYSLVTGGGKNSIPPSLLFMTNADSFSNSVYPKNTHSFKIGDTTISSPNSKVSDYLTLYNTLSTSYTARPVYVSYEMNDRTTLSNYGQTGDDEKGAWRLDGRWFYTSAGDLIDSKIEIQYLDGAGGYKTESSYVTGFQNKENKGEHTGAIAYFTDGAFYGERDSGSVVLDKTKSFSMEAQAADGYEFVGWYIKQGDAYPSMNPTNKTAVTATTSRTSSFTFVARYRKLTMGSLVVSNTVATGTVNGTTYNGTGKGKITVEYTTNNGTNWTQIGEAQTENDITVGTDILTTSNLSTYGDNFKLRVTLGNTPDGEDTFGTYLNTYNNRTMGNGSGENVYVLKINDLFTSYVEDETTVYEQNTFSLKFQTYFVQHVYAYSIVYSYTSTRLNANQEFTKTGEFTSAQLKDYVTGSGDSRRLTDAFITEVKPKESNFRQNMAFAVTNKGLTNSGSTTTFTATAAYTNSTNNAVSVTLDIPYRIEDRTADEGYDLTPVETDREYKISGEEGYTSGQDHYRINDTIPTFEVSDDSGYGAYLTNTAELTTTLPDEESTFFLTAPESIFTYDSDLGEDVETKFSYWLVTDTSNNEIVKVYNVKFNYRIFDNYRIKPVYDGVKDVSGDFNKKATITYAGTTRNQWNNSNNGGYTISGSTAAAANEASDILFNDFIIAFNYMDRQVKYIDNAECGIVLEKIGTIVNDSQGNPITDMGTYAEKAADNTDKITTYISSGFANAGGLTLNKYNNLKDNLNDKNRIEFFYNSYNSYGSTASGNLVQRTVASSNVFRAYSYMKIGDEVILSTPVYYSMYSEAH